MAGPGEGEGEGGEITSFIDREKVLPLLPSR